MNSLRRRLRSRDWGVLVALAVLGLFGGCEVPPPQGDGRTQNQDLEGDASRARFESAPSFRSLALTYENGMSAGELAILESLGGGIGLIDFDRDGRLDVCATGGGTIDGQSLTGRPTSLARQLPDGSFAEVGASAGLAVSRHYSHGVCVDDWNNDGFPDLLITGYGGVTLWINQGDGTFDELTETAELGDWLWSSSAAAGDVNGDGLSDLYLCHYVDWSFDNHPACKGPAGQPDVCPPRVFAGLPDTLYLNRGDGTFEEATAAAGLRPDGKGLGVLLVDLDLDRDLDIYVANDTTDNFLYINDGAGHFTETGLLSGVALDHMAAANGSMGIAPTDFNQDGHTDLWVTNYENELIALYRNTGQKSFLHASNSAGLNRLGTLYVGFGCVSEDFDLDGNLDFVCSNGHVVHFPRNAPVRQKPLFLRSTGDGAIVAEVPTGSDYFSLPHLGRGVAAGDLNGDGRPDLAFSHTREPAEVLANRTTGSSRRLALQLIGTSVDRTASGTRVILVTSKRRQLRQRFGGGSYLSASAHELVFAIPEGETFVELLIEWLDGTTATVPAKEFSFDDNDLCRAVIVQPADAQPVCVIPRER